MRTFGLTGGIGAGKSTVAAMLREAGVPVIDADAVAREVVAPGEPALAAIVEAFGDAVLTAEGTLDRAALRARIASDGDARRTLEAITHPAIFVRLAEAREAAEVAGATLFGVEAALMVETGSWRMYDRVVVVAASPAVQRARVAARDGSSTAAIDGLIAAQATLEQRLAVAHHVVWNEGSREALHAAVADLLRALRDGLSA
jgi:dephospho-CoA kinase